MKKLITLTLAVIFIMSAAIPALAVQRREEATHKEEKQVFETDLSVCKEGSISVYGGSIRENIKGEWADCDCYGLCYCTQLYHVLEDTTKDDFYSAFLNGDYFSRPLGKVYQDCSSSMEETFNYETSKILKNLSPFLDESRKNVEDIFKCKKTTNLYGFLASFQHKVIDKTTVTMPSKTPIIITDLWDTEGVEDESFQYSGDIIFCVPYASTNKEGVLHCEDVVNNILWNHSWSLVSIASISIYVVYTDNVIVEYSNGYRNAESGHITIYVP